MGCVSGSPKSSAVHPQKRGSLIGGSIKMNQEKKFYGSEEGREYTNFLDQMHTEANQALDDYYFLEDNFKKKIESISEQNQIYTSNYSKEGLLQKVQANKVPFQIEKLVEIVYITSNALPKINLSLLRVKHKLESDNSPFKDAYQNEKYSILYKIDEARIADLIQDIKQWEVLLKKEQAVSYPEIQKRKRLSHFESKTLQRSLTQRHSINPGGLSKLSHPLTHFTKPLTSPFSQASSTHNASES